MVKEKIALPGKFPVFMDEAIENQVYICGPTQGTVGFVKKFLDAENILFNLGWKRRDIINPVKLVIEAKKTSAPWREQMEVCIKHMPLIGVLCRLDGWHLSNGATVENAIAQKYGLVLCDLVGDTLKLGDDYFDFGGSYA